MPTPPAPRRTGALLAAAAAAALVAASARPARADWSWSEEQLTRIAELEARVKPGRGWPHRIEGEHWRVETAVSARFTAELAVFMDLFHAAFHDVFAELGRPRTAATPTVQVYASQAAYEAVHPRGSRGYYAYAFDGEGAFTKLELYTFVKEPEETDFARFYHPILQHEGTHVLLRRLLGGRPKKLEWLDEGVATWFQFWDLAADATENMRSRYSRSFYRAQHLAGVTRDGGPSLRRLLALDQRELNPDAMGPVASRNYALAESLIEMLLSTREGTRLFGEVFRRVRAERRPLAEAEIDRLERQWRAFLGTVAPDEKKSGD